MGNSSKSNNLINLTRYTMKKIILVTLCLMSINAFAYSDGATFHQSESNITDAYGNSQHCYSSCGETVVGESCMTQCS